MYTWTWSNCCSSPAGCEHPGCSTCVLDHLPLARPVFFWRAPQQRRVIPGLWIQRQISMVAAAACSPGFVLQVTPALAPSEVQHWAQHCRGLYMEVLPLLGACPIFILLAGCTARKIMLKILCIGFVLSLNTFQFSWMLVCSLVSSPHDDGKSHARCFCSGWALMEYLLLFLDYPVVFWTILLSVLVIATSTDWKCVIRGYFIIHWIFMMLWSHLETWSTLKWSTLVFRG